MPESIPGWTPLEKAKSSSTFCVLPWIHQYVGTGGDVKPCCIYSPSNELGNLKKNSLEEIYNNTASRKLRLDMLKGIERTECKECNLRGNLTNNTYKNNSNKRYLYSTDPLTSEIQQIVNSTLPDGTVPEHHLYYMDVRFNNLCNFKCVTCSPIFSSSLISDWTKLSGNNSQYTYRYAGKTEDDAYQQMLPHIPKLTEIYFAGGEPMMQKEHYNFLHECINKDRFPTLLYSTNLSRLNLGEHNVIDIWKKFPQVTVLASLDGSYQRAEYWRRETVWSDIVANRKSIAKHAPHVNFFINATVSWPNVYSVLELHKEWTEQGLCEINHINLNPIYEPKYLSLAALPEWKKIQICDAISNHINWIRSFNNASDVNKEIIVNKFITLMNFINQEAESININEFQQIINGLDSLRKGPTFFEVFTEHLDMQDWFKQS